MSEIYNYASEKYGEDSPEIMKHARSLLRTGAKFIKSAPKHFLKFGIKYLATKGFDIESWKEEALSEISDVEESEFSKQIGDCLADLSAEAYAGYISQKDSIVSFRKNLSTLANKFSTSDFPLVIMVDELDRCRPDYAILLLERIKHLFDVENVVFILALEANQLSKTISALYGLDEVHASIYLRKFIDMEYSLPEPSLDTFADYLFAEYNLHDLNSPIFENVNLHGLFSKLSSIFGMSLRDMSQAASQLAAIVRCYNIDWATTYAAIPYIFLKREYADIYKEMQNNIVTWGHLNEKMTKHNGASFNQIDSYERYILEATINCHMMTQKAYSHWLNAQQADIQNNKRTNQSPIELEKRLYVSSTFVKVAILDKKAIMNMVDFAAQFSLPHSEINEQSLG